jgi:hypothetical protein
VTTQNKTTAIYVRTAVHSRTGDQSLAAQEQACRTYTGVLGYRWVPSDKKKVQLARIEIDEDTVHQGHHVFMVNPTR